MALRRTLLAVVPAIAVHAFVPGCKRAQRSPAPAPAPPHPAPRLDAAAPPPLAWYRATLGAPGHEVPFFLGVPPRVREGTCEIANGDQRIHVDCGRPVADSLDLEFPQYATRIRARMGSDGTLTGSWKMSRITGVAAPVPFVATPIDAPDPRRRFAGPAEAAPADFHGTWQLHFVQLGLAKATFAEAAGGVVTGTIIPQDIGDLGALAGNVRGGELWLSMFDGQHAYLVHGTLGSPGGSLAGTWTFPGVAEDRFEGARVPEVALATLETVRLRPGRHRVTIPELARADLAGKPVLVDYTGSWCPSCQDELPFLVELYRRYHPQGLEILSIALEIEGDQAADRRQVDYLRERYGIPWRIEIVHGELTEALQHLPPELEHTGGFPLTLFLARDGAVVDVHSGFYSAAALTEATALRARFEADARALVAPAGAAH